MFNDTRPVDVTRLQPCLIRAPRISPGQFWTKWALLSAVMTIGYLVAADRPPTPEVQIVHVERVSAPPSSRTPQLADVAYSFQMRMRK